MQRAILLILFQNKSVIYFDFKMNLKHFKWQSMNVVVGYIMCSVCDSLTLRRMLMAAAIPTIPTPTTVTLLVGPAGSSLLTWAMSFSFVEAIFSCRTQTHQPGCISMHQSFAFSIKCSSGSNETASCKWSVKAVVHFRTPRGALRDVAIWFYLHVKCSEGKG